MVYDATIQLVTAMDFAHNHKLIHGQLDLSKVKISKGPLAQRDQAEGFSIPPNEIPYYNLEFEITDFAPKHSMTLPLEPEATYWPFSKLKDPKKLTENERMEVLMLKDIYAIGVCILEMMIGRFGLEYNINIDNIPSEWGNLPESSTLIKVLGRCLQLDSISKRTGILAEIRKLLIQDYKKHFNKNYRME
jgi:serine/threonine protein kinase